MRRTAAQVAILSFVLATLFTGAASANHPGTCSTSGDATHIKKTFKNSNGTVDAVDYKKYDTYIVKGYTDIIVDGVGDTDITMCVIGQSAHVCDSHELPGVPDECAGLDANTQYRLDIRHCISAACGEVDGAAVPIAYVVVATNV